MTSRLASLALAAAVLGGTAGCDRPLVDRPDALVQIVTPDLDLVQTEPGGQLQLQVSRGSVVRVTVNGAEATYDARSQTYSARYTFQAGLNALVLEAFDEAGSVGLDTAYAVYYSARADRAIGALPQARSEAAAVALPGGRILVTGGARDDREAVAEAYRIEVSGTVLTTTEFPLRRPRAGHTATRVAEGVLLIGGATREGPRLSTEFEPLAEFVSPLTGETTSVEIEGGSVLRAGHAARVVAVGTTTFVVLYGGVGPSGSGLTTLRTAAVLEWVPVDRRLVVRTPEGGTGSFPAVPSPALVDLPRFDGDLATSVAYDLSGSDGLATQLSFRTPGLALPFEIRSAPSVLLPTPRTDAAGGAVDGLAVVVGGRSRSGSVLGTAEVVAPLARRAFRFPAAADLLVARYNHTATIFAPGRMIVIGGRTASGVNAPIVELYTF